MKRPGSYLVNCALACGVLYWVLSLSSSGRTAIDWVVIGLVVLAILWNLLKLGQRLHRAGGGKDLWHMQRTLLFWIIGLLNTLMMRETDLGSWEYYLGWVFIAVAALDSVALFRKERASVRAAGGEQPPQ